MGEDVDSYVARTLVHVISLLVHQLNGARFQLILIMGDTQMLSTNTKRITVLAMLSAMAFLLTYIFYIMPVPPFMPTAPFLNYEPKDVIIVIAGFLFGPLAVIPTSVVVSLLEMPFSGTGHIGLIMNVLSTCAFACPAAFVYKKWKTLKGAVAGLAVGVLLSTTAMLLWNYFLTPIFMTVPRHVVVAMLVPVFLPFNLVKGTLNAAMAVMLYKSVKLALDKSKLLPVPDSAGKGPARVSIGALLVSAVVLISCILIILSWQGVI